MKARRIRTRHSSLAREVRVACRIAIEHPEGKRPLARLEGNRKII
jgi:hypothetical protein